MMTPCGIELKVGQVWRELDTRFSHRDVRVVDFDARTVRIQTVTTGDPARITRAALRRFNGKHGGYEFVG